MGRGILINGTVEADEGYIWLQARRVRDRQSSVSVR